MLSDLNGGGPKEHIPNKTNKMSGKIKLVLFTHWSSGLRQSYPAIFRCILETATYLERNDVYFDNVRNKLRDQSCYESVDAVDGHAFESGDTSLSEPHCTTR